ADYLDRETAQIDTLIAKQEQLIVLLKERARNTITEGASGRLCGRALKDSELTWIGRIPEHWVVVPTRSALEIRKQLVGDAWDSTPLLSLTKEGIVQRDIDSAGKHPESYETYQVVEPGDLVFCLFDMDETPRTVGHATRPGMITGAYTRFRVNREVALPAFLTYYYIAIDNEK